MPEVTFKIDPEEAKAAVRDALMGSLTPAKRDELVRSAVEALLKGDWQHASELQRLFADGARMVAREVFVEEFAKPETRAKVRELVAASIEKAFEKDGYDKLVEKLGDAVGRALTGDRY